MRKAVFRSEFLRYSFQLAAGTMIAQVIPVLAVFVLAHYYTKEEFGRYHLFFQITTSLAPVLCLRMEQPMLAVEHNEEADQLFKIGARFSLLIGALITIIMGVAYIMSSQSMQSMLGQYGWFIGLSATLAAQIVLLQYYANRKKRYAAISISKIVLAFFANMLPIAMIYWHTHALDWLIIGWVLGLVLSWFYLTNAMRANALLHLGNWRNQKKIFIKWKLFATTNTPALLADQLAALVPIMVISYVFGSGDAGSYGFAQRVLIVPMVFLGSALSQVFFKKSADLVNANLPLMPGIKKVGAVLAIVGVVSALVIIFLAEDWIPVLFGDQWREAAWIMVLFAMVMVIKLPVSALSNVFVVTNKIKMQAVWQLTALLFTLVGAVYCIVSNNFRHYLYWLVVQDTILYLLYFMLLVKVSQDHDARFAGKNVTLTK